MKNKPERRGKITRRKFVNIAASGSMGLAALPLAGFIPGLSPSWPANASQFRFHMIGHAHIDPVWLWPWTEGLSVVHSTFRSNLDRLKETPGACFISSSAQFYQWVSENDPEMLAEIRKRIDEGRWNIVGGWWVEPDVNIPSGESLIRQGLYGQLTLQRLLGRRAKVGFNPDSFGHAGTLPQILRSQGMQNYVFMRPGPNEKNIPADLFWWEGPDGSRVLTYRIQISYNDGASVRTRLERILAQSEGQPMKTFMAFYGAGDHGGGATKENLESIEELRSEKEAPAVYYSTPEKYFAEIRENRDLQLPVVHDDLQHHAPGCYTAESAIKKGNRQSETALTCAEKIASTGYWAWKCNYPAEQLSQAWKKVLFLQFHDSLAGTSLFEHSQAACEGYGYAISIANDITYAALQKLEWQVPAEDPASQYILVFNPHAWETTGIVSYDFNRGANHKSSRVEDESGKPLHHQWTAGSTETGSRKKLLVKTSIPPFGYRQIRLMDGENETTSGPVSAEDNTLENEFIRVRILKDGSVTMLDKETGKETFGADGGCRALIIDDPSDTWSHDVKSFSKIIGNFGNAATRILEPGPLRAIIRCVTTYGNSALTVDWTLVSGSRHLSAEVTLDWKEKLKMLKFSFPVNVQNPLATYETPYGFIERATNGDEDPGQRWIDLTGSRDGKAYGLTVFNDAKYGYSVHGNDMRLSVARSAVYAHHAPRVLDMNADHLWMDQGIQTFRMMLLPHNGTWKEASVPRHAEEFSIPALVIYQGIHPGKMPKSGSFMSIDAENIIVPAVKQAESGRDTIIRCLETHGSPATASLDIAFAGKKQPLTFRPYEIKTIRVNSTTGEVHEVNVLEE
jgi:alpha-mannosidase